MQLAGDPQPGLVEPGGLGLDDAVLDLVEEPVQPVGGPRGDGRDGLTRVCLVGDRGMLTSARIDSELRPAQLDWIHRVAGPADQSPR